jgi:MFS family permease
VARDLRLFYLFRLLATSYLWVPIFVFFLRSRGLAWDDIMILGALYCCVVILVEIPTGAFADRIGRRQSLMAGTLTMVASCLVAYFAHSFASFAVAEVLAAVSMSLCSGADSAYLFDLLYDNGRGDEYAHHESKASAWHQAGQTLAFAGGGLLATVDLALPYLATAVVSGAAFVVTLMMRGERRAIAARKGQVADEWWHWFRLMAASLRDVRRNRALAWVVSYSAVVFVLLKATVYLYQPFLRSLDFGYAETGFVFAGVYLVATFVAHQAHALRRALGEAALVWGLLFTLGLSFLLLNQVRSQWAILLLVVQAIAMGLYSPLVKPLLNREIPDSDRRATVLSVESIAKRTLMIGAVFAPIAGLYEAGAALYWCGGVGMTGLALLALFRSHFRLRRRSRVPRAGTEDAVVPPVTTLD